MPTNILYGSGLAGSVSLTGPILVGNGSAALPAYSFSSDTGVGLSLNSGTLYFSTGGAYRLSANSTNIVATVPVTVPMGTSGSNGTVPSVANVNITPVGTGNDVTEDTLMTYTLPANALSANGKGVRITALGNTLAAANNQTIKLYFGATAFVQIGSAALGTAGWKIVAEVLKTGSNAQTYGSFHASANTLYYGGAGTLGITDTAAIIIKVTGTNGVATVNGVQQLGLIVEFFN